VLIMAGGTGGHVFPGLALAETLRQRGVPVVWLGSRSGLEARLVPARGIPVEWIEVRGMRGKGLARVLTAPLMLTRALWQALTVLRRLRPLAAVGMGGFVSGPGGIVAAVLRVPLLVHEQNAVAGWTNRFLAHFARVVFEAFPGSFPVNLRAREVGNPVRGEIVALPPPGQRETGRRAVPRLLVLGGSQGALALNEMVPAALSLLAAETRPAVHHQAGERMLEAARDAYRRAGVVARVEPFIDDMAAAYGWADLVVCRAGALTISELAAAGVASVLVPYPHAVDDHQTANARFLVDAGAALLVQQSHLDPAQLAALLVKLFLEPGRLAGMAAKARGLARTDAAERVAEEVMRHAC
jgi:UDP-N-acetylglucosamine--N-acetylmuramyl-(pentapeptide) pyrophosphoryl-undecaprenol N-acetylglucosamine transferase